MSTGRLIGSMGALVLVGAPMVWYLWEVLNEALAGHVQGTRLLISLPVLLVFIAYLRIVSRTIRRWDASV